jgi:hypothetical protein
MSLFQELIRMGARMLRPRNFDTNVYSKFIRQVRANGF